MLRFQSKKYLLYIVSALLLGLFLVGCTTSASQEPVVQTVVVEVTKEVVREVEHVVTSTAESVPVPRVALIMSRKRNDQSWNQFMADSVQRLADQGKIEASFAEDVASADFERVAGDYAEQGYDLIIGHTADYTEPGLKVADLYPDTNFAITTATQFRPNLAGLNIWTHKSSAVAGYLSALLSDNKVVGIIGAFSFPTQLVAHEGFKFGVYSANREFLKGDPDIAQVHCLETFTNTWSDSALGYEAAIAQMDQGADYIYITTSGAGFGVIQAAQQTGQARVIGSFVDMNSFAPDVVITTLEWVADVPLESLIADIQAGSFSGKDYGFDLSNGGTRMSPYHGFEDVIPDEVKEKVNAFQESIIAGRIRVPFVTAKLGGETGCEVPTN